MNIRHIDGRPRLKEFNGERKLFFRSLYEWCRAEGVCPRCRQRPVGLDSFCQSCLDRRKQ